MNFLKEIIKQTNTFTKVVLVFLSVYTILIFLYSLYGAIHNAPDQKSFYDTSKRMLEHKNPFRTSVEYLKSTESISFNQLDTAGGRSLYPPSAHLLFIPFFAFMYSAQAGVLSWAFWNVFFAALIFSVIRQRYLLSVPAVYVFLFLLIVFGGYATKSCFRYGQTSIFSFAFFMLTVHFKDRNKWLGGLCFSFACIKPSLMILFAIYFLIKRHYLIIGITVFVHAALTVLAAFWMDATPVALIGDYCKKISLLTGTKTDLWLYYQINGVTLKSLLYLFNASSSLVTWSTLTLYGISMYIIYRLREAHENVVLAVAAFMTLFIDYHWHYDFIVLLLVFPLIVKSFLTKPKNRYWLYYYVFLMFMPNLLRAGEFLKNHIDYLVIWQCLYTGMYGLLGIFFVTLFFEKDENKNTDHLWQC